MSHLKILSTLLLLLVSLTHQARAQATVESLVENGIRYHDQGAYEKALVQYRRALRLDSANGLVFYEMAYSFAEMDQYDSAIVYARKAMPLERRLEMPAAVMVGNALDMKGLTDSAVAWFHWVIDHYDADGLLYYNLGVTYLGMDSTDVALTTFEQGVMTDPNYANGHFSLGQLNNENFQVARTLLAFYHYLLLQPVGPRAQVAREVMAHRARVGSPLTAIMAQLQFADSVALVPTVDMRVADIEWVDLSRSNLSRRKLDRLVEQTRAFFTLMGEERTDDKEGVYWEVYVPMFYRLAKTEHLQTFVYLIVYDNNPRARRWLVENSDALRGMAEFFADHGIALQ